MIALSPKNPMRVVLLSVLLFEVIVFALAIPVMIFISEVPAGLAAGFGGGAAVLALVAAGTMRRPIGYPLGWFTQVVGVALGFLTSSMFIVGLMFLAIWLVSFILGKRLDQAESAA
jgi:preprotein translocase subunit SecG